MSARAPILEGTILGPFRLGPAVGTGGMGAVYRAEDGRDGSTVAVKLLLCPEATEPDWHAEARRLRDEARVAALVPSPHLVRLIDTGDDERYGPYIVYEFLPRGTLSQRLAADGPMTPSEAVTRVARPLLSALAALHRAGVVHRDIKPDNLFEAADGTFKVGDLGLALFADRMARTVQGALVGTPGYLAPERVHHPEQPATPAADCYAAALTVIRAMTGRLPFRGDDPIAVVHDQMHRDVRPACLIALGVPESLAHVLAGALQRRPEARLADADTMLAALVTPNGGPTRRTTQVDEFRADGSCCGVGVTTRTMYPGAFGAWWVLAVGLALAGTTLFVLGRVF